MIFLEQEVRFISNCSFFNSVGLKTAEFPEEDFSVHNNCIWRLRSLFAAKPVPNWVNYVKAVGLIGSKFTGCHGANYRCSTCQQLIGQPAAGGVHPLQLRGGA